MLLLHSIIVLGTVLASSRAKSNPYIVVAQPDQEESNDTSWLPDNFGVEGLPGETDGTKVCQTEECRLTGQELLRNLNKSVDPCNNFYDYACGGWIQNNPKPAAESTWNSLKNIEKKNKKRIRDILKEPEKDTDIVAVKAAKRFHQSCMDLDAIEKLGIKPLEQILEVNGGWPMIMGASEWTRKRISWRKVQENYQLLSRDASLFSVTVDADLDRNVNVIKLKQHDPMTSLAMLIKLEKNGAKRSRYVRYVQNVALTFAESRNSNVSSKAIFKDVEDMLDFETKLHELYDYEPTDGDLITVDTLQELYNHQRPTSGKSKINWLKTLRRLFKNFGIRVNETDKILASNYRFFTKLPSLLGKTSRRTIVNYLHWKFVSAMVPYANKKMRIMNFLLKRFVFHVRQQNPRWEVCISENPFKDAVSYQFVHKYLPEISKKKAMNMINEIQDQVKIQISNSSRLSDKSKSQAKEKLWNIEKFIGFPNWFNNVSAIIDLYKGLTVGPSYINNILNYNNFSIRNNLKKLLQPIDNSWLIDPFTVNAYRDFIKNSLIFPTTTLQLPLFGASRPNAVNYGAIGTIIGHELSYPYRNLGIAATTREKMSEKSYIFQVLFAMLPQTPFPYIYVNKEIMKICEDKNIADVAGLRTAYKAYQSKLAAGRITEEKLPGLEDYSSQQIFFLSFANNWCESVNRKKISHDTLTLELSEGQYRVIMSVLSVPGFGEAFKCPAGSRMNPKVKCDIWD